MSSKCDVVVVGGGISGQWPLSAFPILVQFGAAVGGDCAREPRDSRSSGEDLGRPQRRRGRIPPSGMRFGEPLDWSLRLEVCGTSGARL